MKLRVRTLSIVFFLILAMAIPLAMAAKPADTGFDAYGYNRKARVFVGIGENWYRGKYRTDLFPYPNDQTDPMFYWDATYGLDHLVMKWNAEWDRGNAEGWLNPPYEAWCTNEWNGMVPGGSGETWQYKNIWVGAELDESPYWREGGYAIWGQFEVILSHGTYDGEHFWDAHAIPTGLGGITK